MQKPLTPKQQLEIEKLNSARIRAEHAMNEIEQASGKNSPQYAVAERQRDEILAKMQGVTRIQDVGRNDQKPIPRPVGPIVIKSRRIIGR